MFGLMQDWPLLAHTVIDHAARFHGNQHVISRSVEDGQFVTTNYKTIRSRALQMAKRLQQDGVKQGDRIATLAWNTSRHLECWYGIMGCGAIYHTLNPRLFPEQLAWIMNDAEDSVLFVDLSFLPIVEAVAPNVPTLRKIIVLTDAAYMPESPLELVAFEDWLAETDNDFAWVKLDENTAAGMCYTSGTTGDPKGVIYSHRSNILHAMAVIQPDFLNFSAKDRVMPVVPLFHANGWSTAFSAPMVGAAMIMPGAQMDGASIYEILTTQRVTVTAAVPTVWMMLLQYLDKHGGDLPDLDRVVIGGSACPRAMIEAFENRFKVEVLHAWGMTELSPLGSFASSVPATVGLKGDALFDLKVKQGRPPYSVEMKVTDDENQELPWDGKTFGRLKVRGPAVSGAYYKARGADLFDDDGYFDTGDVAHLDSHGFMQITDRSKDVIKSGGEWISSIEIENLATGHPDVAEAAVIGIVHPKWDERPLLVLVAKADRAQNGAAVLEFLQGKIAKWWMPDAVVYVDEIPHTATGKIQKATLRQQFSAYRFPNT